MNYEEEIRRFSRRERIEILLEEYRCLNALLLFRLNALDRRLPVTIGLGTVSFASLLAIPSEIQVAILIAVPTAVHCLVRATAQHAKAKEDHLRRIDEIEQQINRIAGEELIVFQSRHTSKGIATGGRTGRSTIVATIFGAFISLFLSLVLFFQTSTYFPSILYVGFVALVALDIAVQPISLGNYQYDRGRLIYSPAQDDTHSV